MGGLRALAQYLQADGALASDHIWIIKGVDKTKLALGFQFAGPFMGFVVGITVEQHLSTQPLHRFHLCSRRCEGHHDQSFAAKFLGRQGHPLGVVAGTCCDHPLLTLLLAQLHHLVEGAAQFE